LWSTSLGSSKNFGVEGRITNFEAKAVIRLNGGPADGFEFTVPVTKIPRFVTAGRSVARYEREPSDGEVIYYRFNGGGVIRRS
jgi:hypothetical protein